MENTLTQKDLLFALRFYPNIVFVLDHEQELQSCLLEHNKKLKGQTLVIVKGDLSEEKRNRILLSQAHLAWEVLGPSPGKFLMVAGSLEGIGRSKTVFVLGQDPQADKFFRERQKNFRKLEFVENLNPDSFDLQFTVGYQEQHLIEEVIQDQDKEASFSDPEKFIGAIASFVQQKSKKLGDGIQMDLEKLTFLSIRNLSLNPTFYDKNQRFVQTVLTDCYRLSDIEDLFKFKIDPTAFNVMSGEWKEQAIAKQKKVKAGKNTQTVVEEEEETKAEVHETQEVILSEAEKEYFSKLIPILMDKFRAEFYKQRINQILKLKKLINQQSAIHSQFLTKEKRSLESMFLKYTQTNSQKAEFDGLLEQERLEEEAKEGKKKEGEEEKEKKTENPEGRPKKEWTEEEKRSMEEQSETAKAEIQLIQDLTPAKLKILTFNVLLHLSASNFMAIKSSTVQYFEQKIDELFEMHTYFSDEERKDKFKLVEANFEKVKQAFEKDGWFAEYAKEFEEGLIIQ